MGLTYCSYAMVHILNYNEKLSTKVVPVDRNLQSFLETGCFSQSNTLDQIYHKAINFTQN